MKKAVSSLDKKPVLNQPLRGICVLIVSLTFALGIATVWTPEALQGGPFAYVLCLVPVLVINGLCWKGWPAGNWQQPLRGIVLLVLAACISGAVFMWTRVFIGRGVLSPLTNTFGISVVTLFVILSPMLEFWPFAGRLSGSLSGFAWLVSVYVIGFIVFRALFDFSALDGASWYNPAVDPGGLFASDIPLSVIVMGLPFCYAVLHLERWPYAGLKQPWSGLISCLLVWGFSLVTYLITTSVLGFGVIEAQVKFGVYGVFGMMIWLMMFENWPGAALRQPLRGLLRIVPGIVLSIGMFYLVRTLGLWLFPASPALEGDGLYQWMAVVALGLCFPFFALYTAMFQSWPFPTSSAER